MEHSTYVRLTNERLLCIDLLYCMCVFVCPGYVCLELQLADEPPMGRWRISIREVVSTWAGVWYTQVLYGESLQTFSNLEPSLNWNPLQTGQVFKSYSLYWLYIVPF